MRADQAEAFAKRLTLYRLRAKVEIAVAPELAVFAAGDGRTTPRASPSPQGGGERPPIRGLPSSARRWVAPAGSVATDAAAADWHRHRIALAIPEGGVDFVFGDTFPHDAAMDSLNGVAFEKGCYIGQEVVSRMRHRGTARRRIVALHADGAAAGAGRRDRRRRAAARPARLVGRRPRHRPRAARPAARRARRRRCRSAPASSRSRSRCRPGRPTAGRPTADGGGGLTMPDRPGAPPRAWQRMLSGRRLDLLDPSPLDIEIEDIAHGLARVARWNGQTVGDHAFSVAQHSLLVERILCLQHRERARRASGWRRCCTTRRNM